jgi:hypothetical protein
MSISGLQDLLSGFIENFFVIGVLPKNKALNNPKETLTLLLLCLFCGKFFWAGGGVIDNG